MTSLTCIYTSKLMYKYIIKDASKWLTMNRNGGSVSSGMVAQSWPDWWLNWVRNTHLGMERAERIQKLAKGTFGISIAMDAFTLELRLLLQQIEFIEEQITEIEEAIDRIMEQMRPSDTTPYRHVIETIPGIGPVLAAAILGEIGDIHRFQNAKSLVAFAGIDATVRASGQFEGTRNRMSKRGSPVLRNSLWMAAVSARRFNPEYKEYYDSKRSEGKHSGVVTGAIARKLTHLIYALWTADRPFDPDYRWEPPAANENAELLCGC